ncbi:hypothetical protein ACH5RR_014512 [Cinchona calisaya]|uniref:Uncharacterized protein n=1 Tax=Cinchona calisaya TaxID=153742 RepID=A0ABD3A6H8_9GENT
MSNAADGRYTLNGENNRRLVQHKADKHAEQSDYKYGNSVNEREEGREQGNGEWLLGPPAGGGVAPSEMAINSIKIILIMQIVQNGENNNLAFAILKARKHLIEV